MSKTVNLRLDFYDKRRSAVQRILQPWCGRIADAAVRPNEAGGVCSVGNKLFAACMYGYGLAASQPATALLQKYKYILFQIV